MQKSVFPSITGEVLSVGLVEGEEVMSEGAPGHH